MRRVAYNGSNLWRTALAKALLSSLLKTLVEALVVLAALAAEMLVVLLLVVADLCWRLYHASSKALRSVLRGRVTRPRP